LSLDDSQKLYLGTGDDLQIYHDGSNSYIVENGTGDLNIQANEFYLKSANGGVTAIHYDPNTNHEVNLYHNNSVKLTTTSSGVTITGTATATSFSGDGSALSGVGGESDITSCLFS